MKVGAKLKCISTVAPDRMRLPFLTLGKEYTITFLLRTGFYFQDDRNLTVFYSYSEYENYFQSITAESLEELGFEYHEWQDEGETFHEWIKHNGVIKVEVGSDFSVCLTIHQEYEILPNCKTITDLKHLIRILGV